MGLRSVVGRHVRGVGHDDETLHLRQVGLQLLEERHEGEVGEDPLILGMVDDVGELVGEEPRVQRVDDGAAAP